MQGSPSGRAHFGLHEREEVADVEQVFAGVGEALSPDVGRGHAIVADGGAHGVSAMAMRLARICRRGIDAARHQLRNRDPSSYNGLIAKGDLKTLSARLKILDGLWVIRILVCPLPLKLSLDYFADGVRDPSTCPRLP